MPEDQKLYLICRCCGRVIPVSQEKFDEYETSFCNFYCQKCLEKYRKGDKKQ